MRSDCNYCREGGAHGRGDNFDDDFRWICLDHVCEAYPIEAVSGQCASCGEELIERKWCEIPHNYKIAHGRHQCLSDVTLPRSGVGSARWAQDVFDALADHGFDLTHPVGAVKALIAKRDEARRMAHAVMNERDEERREHAATCHEFASARGALEITQREVAAVRLQIEVVSRAYERLEALLMQSGEREEGTRSELMQVDATVERIGDALQAAGFEQDERGVEGQVADVVSACQCWTGEGDAALENGAQGQETEAANVLAIGDIVVLFSLPRGRFAEARIEAFSCGCVRVNRLVDESHDEVLSGWYSQTTGESASANEKPWRIQARYVARMPDNQEAK